METNLTSMSFKTMLFKLNLFIPVPMLKSIELEGNDQRCDRLAQDDKTLAESILSTGLEESVDFKVKMLQKSTGAQKGTECCINVTSLHVDS